MNIELIQFWLVGNEMNEMNEMHKKQVRQTESEKLQSVHASVNASASASAALQTTTMVQLQSTKFISSNLHIQFSLHFLDIFKIHVNSFRFGLPYHIS